MSSLDDPAPRETCLFEVHRAARLFAGVLAATAVGAVYALFGVLSDPLKTRFGFTQENMALISTVAFCFAQFNVPAGILFDRFGPRVVNAFALGLTALGELVLALIFAGAVPGSLATVSLAFSLCCFGSGGIDIGTLLPNLYAFPHNAGDVVILQKTFMGLGASVFAIVYAGVFGDDTAAEFCAVCACFALLALVAAVHYIGPLPRSLMRLAAAPSLPSSDVQYQPEDEEAAAVDEVDRASRWQVPAPSVLMRIGFVVLGSNILFDFTVGALYGQQVINRDSPLALRAVLTAVTLLLVLAFGCLVLVARFLPTASSTSAEGLIGRGPGYAVLPYRTLREVVLSLPFALLYAVCAASLGTGALLTATSAQIYRAANENHYNDKVNTWFSTVSGVASALGRIAAGATMKYCPQRHPAAQLAVPPALFAVGLPLFVVLPSSHAPITTLALPFFLCGWAYGMAWAVVIALVQRTFCPTLVGKAYSTLFTAGLVGGAVANVGLFGPLYDRRGTEEHISEHNCAGPSCYSTTMLLLAACNAGAVIAAIACYRCIAAPRGAPP